ncbi:MAG: PepSY domain-containing protein [Gammaproteobacteria bacterium]|nr:PepSY domain-containing protein [Gammaproteobacteria bacterium]
MGRLNTFLLVSAVFITGLCTPAWADMGIKEIRQLVEQAKILPLEQMIQAVEAEMAGRAIEVELEQKDGVFIYEIEWLDKQGRVWEFTLDAKTAVILKQERD